MPGSARNPKVDEFIRKAKQWREEYAALREIVLGCDLAEDFKWMHPCYTVDGRNVVLIHGFKEYCALLFPKGVLLSDIRGVLVQQTENVQAARQIRFRSLQEIVAIEPVVEAYVREAIEVERAGLEVPLKDTSEYLIPDELQGMFEKDPAFKAAFEALTPGRQRGYILYFSAPKQAKTRQARIEKCQGPIFAGRGLNDPA